eukprot:TCONS_00073685-protein
MKTDNKYYEKTMAAMNITICPNGDQYVRKRLVLNRKRIPNLEVLLDNATQLIGARNCVRLLRTPNHGTRVRDLDSVVDGGLYVAIVGPSEKLKKLEYNGSSKPQPKQTHDGGKRKPKIIAQGRAFQEGLAEASRYRIIYIYPNGGDKRTKILLDKRLLYSLEKVLQYISDKLRMRTGAVRSIYSTDGHLIKDIASIQNNSTYVAVGFGQRLIRTSYDGSNKTELLTPRRPVQNKFSGSDSSRKKFGKKIQSKEQPNKSPTKSSADTTTNLSSIIDDENDKIDTIDDSIDKLSDRLDDTVNESNDFVKNTYTLERLDEFKPSTEFDRARDIIEEDVQSIKREGTFDKVDNTDIEQDSIDIEKQSKKTKKNSKAFGSSFDKALAKAERSSTIDSVKSTKQDENEREKSIEIETKNRKESEKKKTSSKEKGGKITIEKSKNEKKKKSSKKVKKITPIPKSPDVSSKSPKIPSKSPEPRSKSPEIGNEEPISRSRRASSIRSNPTDSLDDATVRKSPENISKSPESLRKSPESATISPISDAEISVSDDEENEKEENRKSDSPTLYQASGGQSEKAKAVTESKDTKTEKTIDMVPAEEVDEEIESEQENEDEDENNGDGRKKSK